MLTPPRRLARLTIGWTAALALTIVACTPPIRRPPKLGADASDAHRRRIYGEYRWVRLDNETVAQGNDLLDISQMRSLSESCPSARAMIPGRPIIPVILGVLGAGLIGAGTGRELFEPDAINLTVIGIGAAVAATAIVLELALNPAERDMNAITTAYNKCLLDEINSTRPATVDTLPLPPRIPAGSVRRPAPTVIFPEGTRGSTTADR